MPRVARLQFNWSVFKSGLNAFILRDVLLALPSDTKVTGFSNDYLLNVDEIMIESSSFIDTPMGQRSPTIIVHMKTGSGGVVWFDRLDMSAATGATSCGCGVCYTCLTGSPAPILTTPPTPSPWAQSISTNPSGINISLPQGIVTKFMGIDVGLAQGCNHDWKIYDSGFSRDEYCTKCPAKRDVC